MGDQPRRVTLGSFTVPNPNTARPTIQMPATDAHNFEIKPALVNLVSQNQFGGGPLDDPNLRISHFLDICDTVRIQGVPQDTIRLVLFQFSLRDRALEWLFPPSKIDKLRAEITPFKQRDQENFYEAWDRYKELLRKYPHHSLPDWMHIQCFINGLDASTGCIVDASAGGSINTKTIDEAKELIEIIAENHYQGRGERKVEAKGMYELDTLTALLDQNKTMNQHIAALTKRIEILAPVDEKVMACTLCGCEHPDGACMMVDEVSAPDWNYIGNLQRPPFQQRGHFQGTNGGEAQISNLSNK